MGQSDFVGETFIRIEPHISLTDHDKLRLRSLKKYVADIRGELASGKILPLVKCHQAEPHLHHSVPVEFQ